MVYEGDVILVTEVSHARDGEVAIKTFATVVEWLEGAFLVSEDQEHDVWLACYFGGVEVEKIPLTEIEVIGNIHQDPGLVAEVQRRLKAYAKIWMKGGTRE